MYPFVKTESASKLPNFLLEFTSTFLKSLTSLSHQNEQVFVELLQVCQQIGKSHACALTTKLGDFVKCLNDGLADIEELYLMTPTNSMANLNFESHASDLKKHVFLVLKSIASTPLGLYSIVHQEGLFQTLVHEANFYSDEMVSSITCEILREMDLTSFFSNQEPLEASFNTYAKMSVIITNSEMFTAYKSR